MKKNVKISNRAIGPTVSMSYKNMAKRRQNKANGSEGVSVIDFINEDQIGQTLQTTIKNESETDITVALYPGRLTTKEQIARYAGLDVDYVASEGEIKNGETLIATITSKTLNLAKDWIRDHPMRFCLLKVSVDSESQLSKEIGIASFALGKKNGSETIRPIEHQKAENNNTKLVEIPVSMQLDDATVFYVEVGAKHQLDLSLQIVSEVNTAYALNDIVNKIEA